MRMRSSAERRPLPLLIRAIRNVMEVDRSERETARTASHTSVLPTGYGSPTSPNTAPVRAGSTARSFSTCSPGGSWAGPSLTSPHRARRRRPRHGPLATAPGRHDGPLRSRPSTRRGCSVSGSAKPGCSARWGKVACAYDNSVMESFFGSMQIELLDRRAWPTRAELSNAIFEWIEAFYNPTRRHSALGYLSPYDEALHTTTATAA